MSNNKIIPIILCGGSGTRLWPLSRESFPKQFLSLFNNKNSLLQNTQLRVMGIKNIINPILVCNEEHRFIVAEQMREINVNPNAILLEPFGRNTGAAITIGALKALEIEKDPTLLVLSSDHEIKDKKSFKKILEKGLYYANNNKLVTFGVIPKSPHTGYGYIKAENPLIKDAIKGQKILEFTEKPNLEDAKKFIEDERYTWNSGIFMFKARTIIEELKKYSPKIYSCCKDSIKKSKIDLDFQRLDFDSFKECPNVAIDICVMEKTNKGIVLQLDSDWSDVGSWEALWDISHKNSDNNMLKGKIVTKSSKNCLLSSENRLLVAIGLNNIIAVETQDAILISEKTQTQKLKEIVKDLKKNNISEGVKHSKIYRPWGNYTSIVEESKWQVKMIEVNSGQKLSLQMHNHRSEHWIVVKGTAKVEIDNEISFLSENESTYIPIKAKHRLSNPGDEILTLIEIQTGVYLGEDDIIRFEDIYGRVNQI